MEQLILTVHLGWSAAEREHAQQVYVDLHINYLNVPAACTNDELHDTDCYYQLSLELQKICSTKSYKLLEALAHDLFHKVKATLTGETNITLAVIKNPPMDNLQQVRFVLSDNE